MQIVDSSNVKRAGYNAERKTLTVEFRKGEVYEYTGVPRNLFDELTDGLPHPWTRVRTRIIKYPCHKIT
jgi:hypothetical protein